MNPSCKQFGEFWIFATNSGEEVVDNQNSKNGHLQNTACSWRYTPHAARMIMDVASEQLRRVQWLRGMAPQAALSNNSFLMSWKKSKVYSPEAAFPTLVCGRLPVAMAAAHCSRIHAWLLRFSIFLINRICGCRVMQVITSFGNGPDLEKRRASPR